MKVLRRSTFNGDLVDVEGIQTRTKSVTIEATSASQKSHIFSAWNDAKVVLKTLIDTKNDVTNICIVKIE